MMQRLPLLVLLVSAALGGAAAFGCASSKSSAPHAAVPGSATARPRGKETLLAPLIAKQTPEHTRFAEGTVFKWVYLEPPRPDSFPSLTQALADELRKRMVVYTSRDSVPEGRIILFGSKESPKENYNEGFKFSYSLHRLTPDRVRVEIRDYEGPTSSSTQRIVYSWVGREWLPIDFGPSEPLDAE